jgi:drug/metabolite transporter (DMT)-like permease
MGPLAVLSPRAKGIATAVVTVTIWTAFIIIARASAQRSLTPFDIVFARYIGAALVLVPWGWWMVKNQKLQGWLGLSPLPFKLTALIGTLGGLGYAMLAYSGFVFAPAAHASVLLPGTLPLTTTLVAVFLLNDRITRSRALGLALILCGDVLVGGASLLKAFEGGQTWKGDVLFLAASTCWAFYSVLARKHALDAVKATMAITVWTLVTYVPAYAVLVLTAAVPSHLGAAPWGEIAFQTVFQGVGSVVISGIAFTKMIQHFGPVRSTMITALVPCLSALGAVYFLGEPLYWNLWAGLALVTSGILFGVRVARPTRIAPDFVA